jgi:hypothetical protein
MKAAIELASMIYWPFRRGRLSVNLSKCLLGIYSSSDQDCVAKEESF